MGVGYGIWWRAGNWGDPGDEVVVYGDWEAVRALGYRELRRWEGNGENWGIEVCCVYRELEGSGGFWYVKGDGGYRWVGVWELGVLLWGSWVAQGGQGDMGSVDV